MRETTTIADDLLIELANRWRAVGEERDYIKIRWSLRCDTKPREIRDRTMLSKFHRHVQEVGGRTEILDTDD